MKDLIDKIHVEEKAVEYAVNWLSQAKHHDTVWDRIRGCLSSLILGLPIVVIVLLIEKFKKP